MAGMFEQPRNAGTLCEAKENHVPRPVVKLIYIDSPWRPEDQWS